ncbi:MAG: hypothetical protein E7031_07995 [Akkermansiaceae bacterium]|nr:hypothetical protein [Akkermansiaceae bacterium]
MKITVKLSLLALCGGMLCSCGEGEKAAESPAVQASATETTSQSEAMYAAIRKEVDTYKTELAAIDPKAVSDKLLDLMILPSDYVSKIEQCLALGDVEGFKLIMSSGDWGMAVSGGKENFLKLAGGVLLEEAAKAEKDPATMVKWVIASGVDVKTATDKKGLPVLAAIANTRNLEVIRILYAMGARLENEFLSAVVAGDVDAVNKELSNGADVNAEAACVKGMTAVGLATINPDTTILSMLVAKGANVNVAADAVALPPIRIAVGTSNLVAFKILADAGADLTVKDDGYTLLHRAAQFKKTDDSLEIIKLLLAKGADINAVTDAGWTPLMFLLRLVESTDADYAQTVEALKIMLAAGADPSLVNKKGKTVRDIFNAEKAPECAQLLDAAAAK